MQGVPQTPGMAGVGRPNNLAVPVPNHLPHVPMQSMQPGGQPGQMGGMGVQNVPKMHQGMGQMPINGMPAAQMQGMQGMQGLQAQHRNIAGPNNANSPDIHTVMQARQIAQNQRAAVQMQQSGQHAGQAGAQMHQSPPNNMRPMPNMAANGQFIHSQSNPQSLAAQQAMHNFTNSPSNPQPPPNAQQHLAGAAGSPRPAAQMAQIEANYRAKYPTATPDQIRKLVSDAVMLQERQRQQMQQTAIQHAAGNASNLGNMSTPTHTAAHTANVSMTPNHTGMAAHPQMNGQMPAPSPMQGLGTGMQNSPVQYAQMLRAQQERQAAAVAAAAAAAAQANGANNTQQGGQNLGGQQGNVGSGQHAQSQSQSPAMMNRGPSQTQGTPQQSNLSLPQNQNHNNTPKQLHAQMSPPQQPQNQTRMSPQVAAAQQAQNAQNAQNAAAQSQLHQLQGNQGAVLKAQQVMGGQGLGGVQGQNQNQAAQQQRAAQQASQAQQASLSTQNAANAANAANQASQQQAGQAGMVGQQQQGQQQAQQQQQQRSASAQSGGGQ